MAHSSGKHVGLSGGGGEADPGFLLEREGEGVTPRQKRDSDVSPGATCGASLPCRYSRPSAAARPALSSSADWPTLQVKVLQHWLMTSFIAAIGECLIV